MLAKIYNSHFQFLAPYIRSLEIASSNNKEKTEQIEKSILLGSI